MCFSLPTVLFFCTKHASIFHFIDLLFVHFDTVVSVMEKLTPNSKLKHNIVNTTTSR